MKANNVKGGYYNNSHLCGQCTGSGCKHCYGGLSGTGRETFPLSYLVSEKKPPYIQNPYAEKLQYYASDKRKAISLRQLQ